MHSLRELQITFAHGLMHPGQADLEQIVRVGSMSAEAHADCYRTNVISNYRETLRAVYPVVERLVGTRCFEQAADWYGRAHPSSSGDLNRFGRHFPDFLQSYAPVQTLEYLADVAWLEWALEECFYAADVAPLDVTRLAAVAPEGYAELRFRLHPAVRLIASRFPLLRIWEVNQPHCSGEDAVDLDEGETFVLVRRDGFAALPESVDHGAFCMLSLLGGGRPFGDAFEYAVSADPAFDVTAFLARHVADGVIAEVIDR